MADMAAKPAPAQSAPAESGETWAEQNALELGGGALALLGLGAGAIAITRRRRRVREDDWYEDQAATDYSEDEIAAEPLAAEPVAHAEPAPPLHEPEVVAAAPPAEASAFAWGNQQPAAQAADESGRRPGETWVGRAYRGPSPANPSLSLRARLKRAAFFDKREREVAAGTAAPVEADEGLPEAMVEERQLEGA